MLQHCPVFVPNPLMKGLLYFNMNDIDFKRLKALEGLDCCLLEEICDDLNVVSFLISCMGCSLASEGLPSNHETVNQTCGQLADKLDKVSEILESYMFALADLAVSAPDAGDEEARNASGCADD